MHRQYEKRKLVFRALIVIMLYCVKQYAVYVKINRRILSLIQNKKCTQCTGRQIQRYNNVVGAEK